MPKVKTARPRAQLRQGRTDWYRIENLGAGSAAVYLYDEVGYWGVTASDFVEELSELVGVAQIDLHINSPGGEVFEGLAIMNCLRAHPAAVTTYVDGIAASIASVIAMAGDRIVMGPHSQLMIHDGSGLCIGNAGEMRKMADLLDFQSDNIAGVYAERAGGTVADWRALMEAETWYSADEAVAAGLADEVSKRPTTVDAGAPEPGAAAAAVPDNSWDLSVFRYAGREAAPAPVVASVTSPADEAAPVVPEPVAPAPAPDPVAAIEPEPVAPAVEPSPEEAPEPADPPSADPDPVPDDVWAGLTAHLTTPATSTVDDLLTALREAAL